MNQTQFSKGDKVFAKMRGYPAWPARIEGIADENRIKYHVYFYGTSQIGIVNANDICLYINNKSKFKRMKYENFPKAIFEIEQDMTPEELAELHAAQKRGVNKNIKKKVKSIRQPTVKEKTPQNTPANKRKSDDELKKKAKKSKTTIVEVSSSSTLPDLIIPIKEEKISSEEETCPKHEKQESIVKLVKKQGKEVEKPAPITTSKGLVVKLVKLNVDPNKSVSYQVKYTDEIYEGNNNMNEQEEKSVSDYIKRQEKQTEIMASNNIQDIKFIQFEIPFHKDSPDFMKFTKNIKQIERETRTQIKIQQIVQIFGNKDDIEVARRRVGELNSNLGQIEKENNHKMYEMLKDIQNKILDLNREKVQMSGVINKLFLDNMVKEMNLFEKILNQVEISKTEQINQKQFQDLEKETRSKENSTPLAKKPKIEIISSSNDDDSNVEFEVEKIIEKRKTTNGKTQYKVHWRGYDTDEDTWENESNLNYCTEIIEQFNTPKISKKTGPKPKTGTVITHSSPKEAKKSKESLTDESSQEEISSKSEESDDVDSFEGYFGVAQIVDKRTSKKAAQTSSALENEEYYEISKIIDMQTSENGEKTFRIRWKGFSSKDDTWEPEENLKNSQIYQDFIAKKGKEKTKKRQSD